jgi:UDP-GlcNAc:undecaprenyl-phosphate GlcNAc-1-phosphate transferase
VLVLVDDKVVLFIGDILFSGRSQGLGILATPFTIIAIVGVINAFNMIDGHDGLTGGVTLISFGVFIYLLNLHSCMVDTHALLYLLATVTTVFLVFNLEFLVGRYRQVFLGDAGSMFLGLVCVYFLINLSREGDEVLNVTSAAWVIGLPLLDMMSVMLLRLSKGRSPLKADRLHIHHVLLDLGFGKYTVLVMLLSLHLIFTLIGLFGTLYDWPDGILFWGMFVVLALYIAFNIKTRTQS